MRAMHYAAARKKILAAAKDAGPPPPYIGKWAETCPDMARPLSVPLPLIRALRSTNGLMLLTALLDWQMHYEPKVEKNNDGWFAISDEQLTNRYLLPPGSFNSRFKCLERIGLVERRRHGFPSVREIRIDYPRLTELLAGAGNGTARTQRQGASDHVRLRRNGGGAVRR
jgi:hypothetical protein